MTQRNVLPIASIPYGAYNRPIELPHLETFPGAACLPTHRAAVLQSGSPPGVRSLNTHGAKSGLHPATAELAMLKGTPDPNTSLPQPYFSSTILLRPFGAQTTNGI